MPSEAGAGAMLQPILMLLIFFAVMYFLMIRPQKKREKLTREMLAGLIVGDKIVTIGGVVGKIVQIKDDDIVVETGGAAGKCCIKFQRSSVREVLKPAAE